MTSESATRILVAELTGEALHRARYTPLPEAGHQAAVGALRELAAGRTDLLAEVAGILEGAGATELDADRRANAAQICRDAGADPELIPRWVEEGKRRAQVASQPPFSGGVR